jgi:hypothetical protein
MPSPRAPASRRLPLILVALAPAIAWAHERWVANTPRFPINRAYFQSMSGEVLLYSVGASITIFGVIVLWYLSAPGIVEALTPVTPSALAREAARGPVARGARALLRFILDGPAEGAFMRRGLAVSTFVFARIPAVVLALGAYQGWLVMPSYPLGGGPLGAALRVTSGVLALWVASGLFLPALGAVMIAVFVYLCVAYGIAGVDAIPVLASAFFYLFHREGQGVNARQLLGMRVSLGFGFFLLGLVNKIYLGPELFIGVGDQHPDLLIGPQSIFPGLTREAWSFTTALGEMVFGLLLFCGAWNRITTALLTLVFANFILVFGVDEVVHVYPIAGFVLLFFRGSSGTSLDGLVFRMNVSFFRWLKHTSASLVHGGAVSSVAAGAAALFMFVPLLLITEVVPVMAGTAVPAKYVVPPLPPPASAWSKLPAPPPHADHAPRHGGIVTMNGDLHVEVVVAASGAIALYPSDASRRPIPADQARGSVRIQRKGLKMTLALRPDPSGALVGSGPPPSAPTDYTYQLEIRGVALTMTLPVPAGGTAKGQK